MRTGVRFVVHPVRVVRDGGFGGLPVQSPPDYESGGFQWLDPVEHSVARLFRRLRAATGGAIR